MPSNVKKKISHRFHGLLNTVFLLFLFMLFITLLRSQILTFLESGFTNKRLARAVDNTQFASAIVGQWFSPTIGRHELNPRQAGADIKSKFPITKEAGGAALRRDTIRPPAINDWLDELLDKIWFVESSGRLNPPDGDGGKAIGPLQIHQCVLDDVNEKFGTNFTTNNCREIESAKLIARLYIARWMDTYKEEIAARIFNGGPRGWRKKSTNAHWEDIRGVR